MARQRLPTKQRRRQIVEAALRLLAAEGPKRVTLKALGEAVGIADASVLKHFDSKDEIIDAAIERFGELLAEDLPEEIDEPLERLGEFFVRRAHKIRAHPELMALAYNERLRDVAEQPASVEQIDAHIAKTATFIRTCIEQGVAAGVIAPQPPAQMWLWIVAGLLRGAARRLPSGLGEAAKTPTPEQTWAALEALLRRA